MPPTHTLSKSDFKVARSCAAKLYYRKRRYPETNDSDEYLQMLAEGGYMVEQLAKQLFPDGTTLEYGKWPIEEAARDTAGHLARGQHERVTLFEATLCDGVRQARVDILRRTPRGFSLYEVKSSSIDIDELAQNLAKMGSYFRSMSKPHGILAKYRDYLEDVTYQYTLLRDLYPNVPITPYLILIDKRRAAAQDGMPGWFKIVRGEDDRLHTAEFVGDPVLARESAMTLSLDVSAEVLQLEATVRDATRQFIASIVPALTRIPPTLSHACRDCEYRVRADVQPNGFAECWGARGQATPHVLEIYRGGKFVDDLIARRIDRVTEIPDGDVDALQGSYGERQRVQISQTKANAEWISPELVTEIGAARWPLHFIDFEAARIAIPHHKGMRPYGQLAFQWSCHTQREPQAPFEHRAYLNTDPRWPNEDFVRALRDCAGDDGTLLVWSSFEKSVLSSVADELSALGSGDPTLVNWIRQAALPACTAGGRQLDMLKICREHYYHPGMQGSNSIKYVLDAIWKDSPEVRARFVALAGREGDPMFGPYAALPPLVINGVTQAVTEGTAAMRAYFAMVYGVERDDLFARTQWSELLREYCKLDTLAMVLIWEHWQRLAGGTR